MTRTYQGFIERYAQQIKEHGRYILAYGVASQEYPILGDTYHRHVGHKHTHTVETIADCGLLHTILLPETCDWIDNLTTNKAKQNAMRKFLERLKVDFSTSDSYDELIALYETERMSRSKKLSKATSEAQVDKLVNRAREEIRDLSDQKEEENEDGGYELGDASSSCVGSPASNC